MRPEDLVAGLEADLVALAAAEADLERDAEVAERTRIERSSLTLADRLRAAADPLVLTTPGGRRHAGRVSEVGDGWVLLDEVAAGPAHGAEHVVVLASLVAVTGLGRVVAGPGRLPPRPLASVLRAWCRDRAVVSVRTVDDALVAGMAQAAYADHLELEAAGGAGVVVPYAAIAVVSR